MLYPLLYVVAMFTVPSVLTLAFSHVLEDVRLTERGVRVTVVSFFVSMLAFAVVLGWLLPPPFPA